LLLYVCKVFQEADQSYPYMILPIFVKYLIVFIYIYIYTFFIISLLNIYEL